MGEHRPFKPRVMGSSPMRPIPHEEYHMSSNSIYEFAKGFAFVGIGIGIGSVASIATFMVLFYFAITAVQW